MCVCNLLGVACVVLWGRGVGWLVTPSCVWCVSGSGLEWPAVDGESPVRENMLCVGCCGARVAVGSWNLL